MSSTYVENDNGFFVKLTLFKDDVNKANFYIPFGEQTLKQLSRSLGKIPYIDITKVSKGDDHKEYETDKRIEELQNQGIDDDKLVETIWEDFKPLTVGKIVDVYDVDKKASYGGVLNTCDLSMEMVKHDNPEVAVLDFILKVEDEAYKEGIRKGFIRPTPSPSVYGTFQVVNGIRVYDPNQFLDLLHVANANIPANGEHAKMKAFCEGSHGHCKKQMSNAGLLPPIENINTTVTQDTIRMSEVTQNNNSEPVKVPESIPSSGFNAEEFKTVLNNYNVPKEVVEKLESVNKQLETLATANEATKKELEAFKEAEQQRKIQERKNLITKHINLDKFGGKVEEFTKKIDWINNTFKTDEDLTVYLNEAFPIKIESADKKVENKDNPSKGSAYSGLAFDPNEILKEEVAKEGGSIPEKKRGLVTWGNIVPLSVSASLE